MAPQTNSTNKPQGNDTATGSTLVDKAPNKRDVLKENFADNKIPTGAHFAQWIDCNLVLSDDNVFVSDDRTCIGIGVMDPSATLEIKGTENRHALLVKNQEQSLLTVDSHNIQMDQHTVFSKDVEIYKNLYVNGVNSSVGIAHQLTDKQPPVQEDINQEETPILPFYVTNVRPNTPPAKESIPAFSVDTHDRIAINKVNPEATMDIQGDVKISDDLIVDGIVQFQQGLTLTGDDDSRGLLKIIQYPDNTIPSIDIKVEHGEFNQQQQFIVDPQGRLGLGLASPQAQFHIYHPQEVQQDIVRIDDNTNDNSPFLIDSEGKIGIGNDSPTNKVDISGNLRIGRGYISEYIPENSLVVEDRIGVNTVDPEAHMHIESAHETALKISKVGRNLLEVNGTTISSENNFELHGEMSLHDSLNVDGDTLLKKNLTVELDTQLNQALQVEGVSTFNDHVKAAANITIKGNLSAEQNLHIGGVSSFVGNAQYDGNIYVGQESEFTGDARFSSNINVSGYSCLSGDLEVKGQSHLHKNTTINQQLTVALSDAYLEELPSNGLADVHMGQLTAQHAALRVENYFDQTPSEPNDETCKKGKGKNEEQIEEPLEPSLLVTDGMLGINTSQPEKALDVRGDGQILGELDVQGNLTVEGNGLVKGDHAVYGDSQVKGSSLIEGDSHIKQSLQVDEHMAININPSIVDPENKVDPQARLHIQQSHQDHAALRIEHTDKRKKAPLIFNDGHLGIGTETPEVELDVHGDANITERLSVLGRTIMGHTLEVAGDVQLGADFSVKEDAQIEGRLTLGVTKDITDHEAQKAQLYVADSSYQDALRIEHMEDEEKKSIVIKQGKLGICTENPGAALDVKGAAKISDNVEINGRLRVNQKADFLDSLDVAGTLSVSQRTELSGEVDIQGKLTIDDKLSVKKSLHVKGASELEKATIKRDAYVLGEFNVEGNSWFKSPVMIDGKLGAGTDSPYAQLHVQSHHEHPPFIIDHKHANGCQNTLLHVENSGNVGVGTDSPQAKLDVRGDAIIHGSFCAESIKFSSGLNLTGISDDVQLGDNQTSDQLIPTQRAVKTYVDNLTAAFGTLGQAITIGSQQAFDYLFNQGPSTRLPENSTILLLPLKDGYDSGSEAPAYRLKNSVIVQSGTSIIGYNPETTTIAKQEAHCRFELLGNANQKVSDVNFYGWTFDGQGHIGNDNGGAFYLLHAQSCKLNCHMINHVIYGDGGAIYGENSHFIEAMNIKKCRALSHDCTSDITRADGGAAYGLNQSTIHAYECNAANGGAVAFCQQSVVVAHSCTAEHSGGAAFRCERLRLQANDCSANARGGAACFCTDMICDGYWLNNNAPDGIHIYASNNLTGEGQERHYWKGDYVGRRIDNDTRVWRIDNE